MGHERTAVQAVVHNFINKITKICNLDFLKKTGTYLFLKYRDMGYLSQNKTGTYPSSKNWDMGYTQKKAVHGVLLKFWDMGYPISKPVHTFSRKFRDMGYSGNIPFYTPVHATGA